MKFSVNNLSPLMKFILGMILILSSVLLESLNKYSFLKGFCMGGGLVLEFMALVSFFKSEKSKKEA